MTRMQLTDEEAQVVLELRRKNETKRAVEKTIDWCHDYIVEHWGITGASQNSVQELATDLVRTARDVLLLEPKKRS